MSATNISFFKSKAIREARIQSISKSSYLLAPDLVRREYRDAVSLIRESSDSDKDSLCERHLWEFLLYGEKVFNLPNTDKKEFVTHFNETCVLFESHKELSETLKNEIIRLKKEFGEDKSENSSLPSEYTPLLSQPFHQDASTSSELSHSSWMSSLFNFFCCIEEEFEDGNESRHIQIPMSEKPSHTYDT